MISNWIALITSFVELLIYSGTCFGYSFLREFFLNKYNILVQTLNLLFDRNKVCTFKQVHFLSYLFFETKVYRNDSKTDSNFSETYSRRFVKSYLNSSFRIHFATNL